VNIPQSLIDRYLDDEATPAEINQLEAWLLADPAHSAEFAQQAILHDQLCNWWRVRRSIDSATGLSTFAQPSSAPTDRLTDTHGAPTRANPTHADSPVEGDPEAASIDHASWTRAVGDSHQTSADCSPESLSARSGRASATPGITPPASAVEVVGKRPGRSSPGLARRLVGRWPAWRRWSLVLVLLMAGLGGVLAWRGRGPGELQAATVALEQLIEVQSREVGQIFRLRVEHSEPIPRLRGADSDRRPVKPTLDGAVLSLGGGGRFVFERQTGLGQPFLTGSNGRESWAVRPWGPVLVASDPQRFCRDVPGQDLGFPLADIDAVLSQLRLAYRVRVEPGELSGEQRLIAVKQRRIPGPRQVEVVYARESREIRTLRLIDLPYGDSRFELRLERQPGSRPDAYFEHASHHAPGRRMEHE